MLLTIGLSRSADRYEGPVGERTGDSTGTGPPGYPNDAVVDGWSDTPYSEPGRSNACEIPFD